MKATKFAAIALGMLTPATAMAHPGLHPDDLAFDLVHALTEPDHLATIALSLVWAATIVAPTYWFKPWRASSWR